MVPGVVSAIGDVREHRGRQELYESLQPAVLDRLCEVAKIQSTGASNRIENISTSEVRLRELMERKVKPANRDERKIAGYRYVLDTIYESHDSIHVTPGVILQLHRDLYRFQDVSFAGRWKDSDNTIAERTEDGSMVARFVPTSAAAAPARRRPARGVGARGGLPLDLRVPVPGSPFQASQARPGELHEGNRVDSPNDHPRGGVDVEHPP